jgi:hypothetical protein
MAGNATGLFDSPLAQELRREFDAELCRGASAYQAGNSVLQRHAEQLNDPEFGPIIFYALAELQMEQGVIDSKVRKRALTYINSGEGLEAWRGANAEIFDARRNVEQELRMKLVGMG